jgi:GPH family glycoside/pentoside/hexuronide:cation symporter
MAPSPSDSAPAEHPIQDGRPSAALPFREKLAVGIGGMPVFFGQLGVKNMAVSVYQMMLGVNPGLLGIVLAIPRLADAFLDPLVGKLSDNCRLRVGRRRPFIAAGAVALALTYGSIWMVSPAWSEAGKLVYLLGTSLLFYVCFAFFSVPYQSLTLEMSPDYDERTSVMGHYAFWYKAAELFYQWIFPLSQIAFFVSPIVGVRSANWGVAALVFGVAGMVPAWLGRERYFERASHQAKVRFVPALREALRDRAMTFLIAMTLMKVIANMIGSSMDYYLLVYYLCDGDIARGSYMKGILSSAYAVVGFASIPVLSWLCHKIGKRGALIEVYVLVVFAGIGKWFLFTPGIGWWLLIDPLLSGPILVAIGMVIPSMLADVCDRDELRHGQRREGMFGALFLWVQKAGIALAFLVTGLALNLVGFDSKLGGHQSAATFFWMRFLLAGATVVTALAALVFAWRYPIGRREAEETRRLLELRRGAV